jgi:hypothetical protein
MSTKTATTLSVEEKQAALFALQANELGFVDNPTAEDFAKYALGKKVLAYYEVDGEGSDVTFTPRNMPADGDCGTTVPTSNAELRHMAKEALDNWLFNEDDPEIDPDGYVKAGLEVLASEGDYVPDDDIPGLFENPSPGENVWDVLGEIAKGIGSGRGR